MLRKYRADTEIGAVTGAIEPLIHAKVTNENTVVEAMVDPRSAATIFPFGLLTKVGESSHIPRDTLQPSDVVLRDYNQRAIPIGAKVELTFRCDCAPRSDGTGHRSRDARR